MTYLPAIPYRRSGFTILELSIVLIIIGLIVGGVLSGKSLIRGAELRATISDVQKLETSIRTFQEKYNCLPGDCNHATDFFGTYSVGCPPAIVPPQTDGTCNGNGDELYTPWQTESLLATNHLVHAGLWPLDRIAAFASVFAIRGLKDSQFAYIFTDDLYGAVPATNRNTISLGMPIESGALDGVILSAIDARMIDTKLDDGMASTGGVLGLNGQDSATNAVVDCINGSGDYDVTNSAAYCRMLMYW